MSMQKCVKEEAIDAYWQRSIFLTLGNRSKDFNEYLHKISSFGYLLVPFCVAKKFKIKSNLKCQQTGD